MRLVDLDGRVGNDCSSAWIIWQRLPDCTEFEGHIYYKWPLDLARDGFCAMYREQPPKPVVLHESCLAELAGVS
jgi:hypothetical protein